MSVIVGLDPSTKTGVAIIHAEKNSAKVLATKETFSPKDMERMDRCAHIAEQIVPLLEEHKPDLAVIEDYGYANSNSLVILVEIGTVLRYFVRQLEITSLYVPPTSLKKFITGDGTSSKNQIGVHVYKKYGFEHPSDNVIDAYALAKFGQAWLGLMDLTKAQEATLKKLGW
jgi:crossover junction endodeoxyribonuclease RuvC